MDEDGNIPLDVAAELFGKHDAVTQCLREATELWEEVFGVDRPSADDYMGLLEAEQIGLLADPQLLAAGGGGPGKGGEPRGRKAVHADFGKLAVTNRGGTLYLFFIILFFFVVLVSLSNAKKRTKIKTDVLPGFSTLERLSTSRWRVILLKLLELLF